MPVLSSPESRPATASRARRMRVTFLWALVLVVVMETLMLLSLQQQKQSTSRAFPMMPAGWKLVSELQVPSQRLQPFSQKLGAQVNALFNTTFDYSGTQLQINTIESTDSAAAGRIVIALRAGKSNPRWVVQNGSRVFEFVVRDQAQAFLAAKARYDFPIQKTEASYRVSFSAWPVAPEPLTEVANKTGAANTRNQLFNLFLQLHAQPESVEVRSKIQQAAAEFQGSDHLMLAGDLQKGVVAQWSIEPAGTIEQQLGGQLLKLNSTGRPSPAGVSLVDVSGRISVSSTAKRPAAAVAELSACLDATPVFPCEDQQIRKLAEEITAGAKSDREKLTRLLQWFSSTQNIRYDGLTGSRYGALQVCQQRFGRCWDYSDLMISLCRSVNLPARQVYGWIYESEGHVWCDVAVDGEWIMVDPTTGTTCGSDYLCFSISESGDMTWIYASPITISPEDSQITR